MTIPDFKPKNCCACKRVSITQTRFDALSARSALLDEAVRELRADCSCCVRDYDGPFCSRCDKYILIAKAEAL